MLKFIKDGKVVMKENDSGELIIEDADVLKNKLTVEEKLTDKEKEKLKELKDEKEKEEKEEK